MNDNKEIDFTEDREFIAKIRRALDVGEVPAHLRQAVHNAAERQVFENRKHSFSRMTRWLSGLTTVAAASVICMYSANQYFGRQSAEYRNLQRLDHIMDLVSLDYDDGEYFDEQTTANSETLTLGTVAERYDRIVSFGDDEEDYYL